MLTKLRLGCNSILQFYLSVGVLTNRVKKLIHSPFIKRSIELLPYKSATQRCSI